MNIIFVAILVVMKTSLNSGYTWTYTDWVNKVWKRLGNNHKQIEKENVVCDTLTLKGNNGVIKSPNFPLHYPNNANCKWIIETPNEFTEIHLQLVKFNVENPKWSKICFKDYVEVFQHIDGKRERKGRYCGKKSGYNITIYGNKAEIILKSNAYRTKKGFNILWRAVKGCGGDIEGNTGDLILPTVPVNDKNVYCEWRIKTASTHNQIKVKIQSLIFGKDYTSCRRGYLSIVDSHNQEVGKYCDSNIPQLIRISGDELKIKLKISRKTKHHQFKATWKSSTKDDIEGQCGLPMAEHERYRRLVGGSPASPGTWPWIVQVRVAEMGENFRSRTVTCGGVLISPLHILTAAHCVVRKFQVTKYEVLVGTVFEYTTERKILMIEANEITVHPNYKWTGRGKPENDIAVITLSAELTLSHTIQPICLPEKNSKPSSDCEFAGWGKTSRFSSHSPQLNDVRASTWGHCDDSPSVLCVTYHGKESGACKGDSGSPVVCRRNDGKRYLAGILSYGATSCPSTVDGHSDVRYYLDWIHNIMNSKKLVENNA